jgi:hypothetical protein
MELIEMDDVDHFLALFVFDTPAFREFAMGAPPVTDDRTVLDFSMPRYAGSGFGFTGASMAVKFVPNAPNADSPFNAVQERTRYYFDHRSSVVPLLTNLGGEDAAAIEARIQARTTFRTPRLPPIPAAEWRRWQ